MIRAGTGKRCSSQWPSAAVGGGQVARSPRLLGDLGSLELETKMMVPLLLASAAATLPPGLSSAIHEYDRAQLSGNRASLERLLAEDYALVNSTGEVETKPQFIAELTDPAYHLDPFTVLAPLVRSWGGGAVAGGIVRLSGSAGAARFDLCLRFADIWRERAGRWQVVYTQVGRLKNEDCKPPM